MAYQISPSYIFLLVCNTLFSSGRLILNVVLPKFLIDELVTRRDLQMLLFWGGLIVINNGLFHLLTHTVKRFLDVKQIYVSEMMNQEMAKKIMNVEYFYLEDPYYLDLKERAVFAIQNQNTINSLIEAVSNSLQQAVTLTGLITLLILLSPLLVSVLILTIILHLLLQRRYLAYQLQFFPRYHSCKPRLWLLRFHCLSGSVPKGYSVI